MVRKNLKFNFAVFCLQFFVLGSSFIVTGLMSSRITSTKGFKNFLSQALLSRSYIGYWHDALSIEKRHQVIKLDERFLELHASLEQNPQEANQIRQEMSDIFLEYAQILEKERFELKGKAPEQAIRLDSYIAALKFVVPKIQSGDPDFTQDTLLPREYSFPLVLNLSSDFVNTPLF